MIEKSSHDFRNAIETFLHAHKALSGQSDTLLLKQGLGRVHHRILFCIASRPGLSIKDLLATLSVTKQSINTPLKQLLAMELIAVQPDTVDKRIRRLTLTDRGQGIEEDLHHQHVSCIKRAFDRSSLEAAEGWLQVNLMIKGNYSASHTIEG